MPSENLHRLEPRCERLAIRSFIGIQDGDRVKLTSRRGELLLPARIDGRGKTPQGTVFVPFFDEMKLVNRLTLDAMDNISYEPDYKKCAVRVERT